MASRVKGDGKAERDGKLDQDQIDSHKEDIDANLKVEAETEESQSITSGKVETKIGEPLPLEASATPNSLNCKCKYDSHSTCNIFTIPASISLELLD